MLSKILIVFFFILALPVILLLVLGSLLIFGKAQTCPPQEAVSPKAIETKFKELDKTGATTITSGEITSAVQNSFGENVKDFRVCFKDNKVNASGRFMLTKFYPTFYLSTELITNQRFVEATSAITDPALKVQNTDVYLGGLGNVPGTSKLFGSIAEGMVNDKLKQMPDQQSYSFTIKGDVLEIKASAPQKKR